MLGLTVLVYSPDEPIVCRLKAFSNYNNIWAPIDFLGLKLATIIAVEDVIIVGTNKFISDLRLNYIKRILSPHIELVLKNDENLNIIHDLRTPLSYLRHKMQIDAELNLKEIKATLDFIINFSDKVLASKLNEIYVLQELIVKILGLYSGLRKKLNFKLIQPEAAILISNSIDLYRIINNLISNVIKYAEEGDVTISLISKTNTWSLKIENRVSFYMRGDSFGLGKKIITELTSKNMINYKNYIEGDVWVSVLESDRISA